MCIDTAEVKPIMNKGLTQRCILFNKKQNIPLVGCLANDIENLFTPELRVASEKEKDRQLKCTKTSQKQ
jgi:hypothetical protein